METPTFVYAALKKIENTVHVFPVKCEVLENPMRTKPNTYYPHGKLQIKIKIIMEKIGEHTVFIHLQLLEDILVYNDYLITNYINELFRNELEIAIKKFERLMKFKKILEK